MTRPTKARGDRAGIIIATLCFVHCVGGPVLLTFAGLSSLIRGSERFESLFWASSAVTGAFVLVPAFRHRHGRRSCLAMFAAGLLVLFTRRYLEGSSLEIAIALIGASLIIGAHALNLRYSRRCACCDPSKEPLIE